MAKSAAIPDSEGRARRTLAFDVELVKHGKSNLVANDVLRDRDRLEA